MLCHLSRLQLYPFFFFFFSIIPFPLSILPSHGYGCIYQILSLTISIFLFSANSVKDTSPAYQAPPNWLYPSHSHSAPLKPLGSKSSRSASIPSPLHSDILDATHLSLPSLIPSSKAQPRIQHSSNPSLLSSRKYTRS